MKPNKTPKPVKDANAVPVPSTEGPQDAAFVLNYDTVSVSFTPGISAEQWTASGKKLAGMTKVSAFALGDWLSYGKEHFPEGYKTAAEITGLSQQYLRNCASVAGRFPAGTRYPTLSLEHHRLLGAIPNDTARKELAEKAVAENLTAAAIREAAEQWKTPTPPPPPLTPEQLAAKLAIRETEILKQLEDADAFLAANPPKDTLELWKKVVGALFERIATMVPPAQ